MRVLLLGRGTNRLYGEITHRLERPDDTPLDLAHDLNDLPWPWPDGAADEIRAGAALADLRAPTRAWLAECRRVLAAGGKLSLDVPAAFDRRALGRDWAIDAEEEGGGGRAFVLTKRAGRR